VALVGSRARVYWTEESMRLSVKSGLWVPMGGSQMTMTID